MGGFGSGRPSGSGRDTVEACRSIDVNGLHRDGLPARRLERAAGSGHRKARGSPGSICAPRMIGCISPIACAWAGASGRTWRRPSASSACPAASVGRGLISFAPAGAMGSPVGGGSPSCMGRGAISFAGTVTASPTPARARAHGTGRCGAPTRSDSGSAAIPERPRHSRRSRRACGGELTNACASKVSRLRCAPTKPSRFKPNACWRGSTNPNAKCPAARGVSGNDRDQARFAAGD